MPAAPGTGRGGHIELDIREEEDGLQGGRRAQDGGRRGGVLDPRLEVGEEGACGHGGRPQPAGRSSSSGPGCRLGHALLHGAAWSSAWACRSHVLCAPCWEHARQLQQPAGLTRDEGHDEHVDDLRCHHAVLARHSGWTQHQAGSPAGTARSRQPWCMQAAVLATVEDQLGGHCRLVHAAVRPCGRGARLEDEIFCADPGVLDGGVDDALQLCHHAQDERQQE